MDWSPPAAVVVALAALLVLAGCAGPVGSDLEATEPSPEEFPPASAVDESVFADHAAAMGTASFTLVVETTRTEPVPVGEAPANESNRTADPTTADDPEFTHYDSTTRYLVEPDAPAYRAELEGWYVSALGGSTIYSNGSTAAVLPPEDSDASTGTVSYPPFDESSDRYLLQDWFSDPGRSNYSAVAIDASFEREGVEFFQGAPVMRYEASGVDALPDWIGDEGPSAVFEEFSATLLLGPNGVVRQFRYEFVSVDDQTDRVSKRYTLSDVGSTDVERPAWVADATAGSTAGS